MSRSARTMVAMALVSALCAACDGNLPLPWKGNGDGAPEAYVDYRRALARREIDSLRTLLVKERGGELDDPAAPYRLYNESRRLPTTMTILSVKTKGDEATIRLREGGVVLLRGGKKTKAFVPPAEAAAAAAEGTVRMVRQDGKWRLGEENWSKEAATAGSVPGGAVFPFLKGEYLPAAVLALSGHVDEVAGVAFASDGRIVSAGYGDRTIRMWDGNTGRLLAVEREEGRPRSLAVSPDRRSMITADEQGRITLRDLIPSGFGPPVIFPARAGNRPQIAVSADGLLLAAASFDRGVSLWNIPERRLVLTLETEMPMRSVAFSPTAPLLAAGSAKNVLFLWDLSAGKGRRIVVPKVKDDSDLSGVAFRPDGARLVASHVDGTVSAWDVAGQVEASRLSVPGAASWAVAFSPDGTVFATADQGNAIHLWRADSAAPVGALAGHARTPRTLAFSPDGRRLASAGAGGEILVWQ